MGMSDFHHEAGKIDLQRTTVLKTGRLKKTGEEYAIVSLSDQHIDQILALRNTVYSHFDETEKVYLASKDRSFFEWHFAAGNEALGIVHNNGRLIAQALIVYPTVDSPETGLGIQIEEPLDTVSVLQGAIVDPAFRGNSLQGVMIDERLAMANRRGRREVYTQVAIGNLPSWSSLLKKGMHMENIGVSPYTGADVYVMRGCVVSARTDFNDGAIKLCPQDYIGEQKELFATGYKGTGFDPAGKTITFQQAMRYTPRF